MQPRPRVPSDAGHCLGPGTSHRPWRQAAQLAQAPPHWAVAGPPAPAALAGWFGRAAVLLAATCGLAAIARAQVADTGGGGGGGGADTGGGGGTTVNTGLGGGAGAGTGIATPDAAPGSLRQQVEGALAGVNQAPGGGVTGPAWTITPAIGVQEEWTDNVFNTGIDRRSSFITQVTPSISINGASSRLTADVYYAPSLSVYVPQGSQNQIGQNLGADATLTVAPEQFYVRASAFGAVQSLGVAQAPQGTVVINSGNEAQTYSFSLEPYLTHRFGGWGSAQVGAAISDTSTTVIGGGGTPVQELVSRQEFATFTSGENFGRLSSKVQVSASQLTGTGALEGGSDDIANYQAGYAITHSIIALASVGWEDITYTGPGAPRFNDGTWSAGLELLPNPDSQIIATYGHQSGATALALNASYAPSASIRLSAQYTDGVTTAAQSLNNALSGASFDATGHPINDVTGQTVQPINNFFGFNGTVYRQRSLSLSASWLLPRDAFQAQVQQQEQTPIGSATAGAVLATIGTIPITAQLANSSGTTGTLSWQHDLSPVTSLNGFVQYGILSNVTPLTVSDGVVTIEFAKQQQNVSLLAFGAGVTWQINQTLSGTLQYSYTSNDYGAGNAGVSANLVVLGLRKTF
jgi:uncharacterized protein (PEP-CTERM system associated)